MSPGPSFILLLGIPTNGCVTLERSLTLSGLQFLEPANGSNICPKHYTELFRGSKTEMDVEASCNLYNGQHFLIIQEPEGTEPVFSQHPLPPACPQVH